MMRAAIYCRVSTEEQEREGTSLQSQLEACKKLAHERGFEVPEEFIILETYSGLTLDRPKLPHLRQWVRDKEVDAVIGYTLDRLSRDPVHFIILQEEQEKARVELILVTETVDSSDLGKLITYIKGYAAKLETQKIRERSMRGLRERAKAGRIPRSGRLYGYNYLCGKGAGEGVRYVNEAQAKWVKQIFHWLVNEGLPLGTITYKLRQLGIPTPSSKGLWNASEVCRILKNPAYIGETYVFTQTRVEPKWKLSKSTKTKKTRCLMKPKEQWIEVPGATPAIIDKDLFEAAQARLRRNRERAKRNTKRQYLLSGHIRCARCHRNYWGLARSGGRRAPRYYRCRGKLNSLWAQMIPVRCDNRNLPADKFEVLVWQEITRLMSQPDLVMAELERKKTEVNAKSFVEQELAEVNKRLRALDREQQRLLQWALKGFPEETVVAENKRINEQRVELKQRRAELETRIEQVNQAEGDIEGIERFCKLARQNLENFTFEDKRLALDVLRIEISVDGDTVRLVGSIPIIKGDIASTPLPWRGCNTPNVFPFEIGIAHPDVEDKILALHKEGIPAVEIAAKLDVNPKLVRYRLRRAGFEPVPALAHPDVEDKQILALHKEGIPAVEIAARLDVNPKLVRYRLRRAGFEPVPALAHPDVEDKQILALHKEGIPAVEIAAKLDVNPKLVRYRLRRAGFEPVPAPRDKHSAAMKEWWQNLENRDKMGAAHTGKHLTAETKAKISANTKKRWQDPEYRGKMSTAHSKGHD